MAPVKFTWDDFWAFYNKADASVQDFILKQVLDIIDSVSSKTKREILKDAPDDVQQRYNKPTPSVAQIEKGLKDYIR